MRAISPWRRSAMRDDGRVRRGSPCGNERVPLTMGFAGAGGDGLRTAANRDGSNGGWCAESRMGCDR